MLVFTILVSARHVKPLNEDFHFSAIGSEALTERLSNRQKPDSPSVS